jgi:hypothetical protein
MFGGAYTQTMLNRFGVDVTIFSVTAKCLRDEQDVTEDEWASVSRKSIVLRCKTGTFTMGIGVPVTIDGVVGQYEIIRVETFGTDGEMTKFWVSKEF